ncbi:hypothetical protein B7463_g3396, partial [Scytalidium lignicola]
MTTTSEAQSFEPERSTSQARTLHIQFDNWKWRKGTILDSDQKTELYRIECHTRAPQIIMYSLRDSVQSPESRGEVTMHAMTSRMDIRIHNEDIKLTSRGILKDGHSYTSPALEGAKLTWQSKSKLDYLNLLCLDENAMPVARTSFANSWKATKGGTIELAGDGVVKDGRAMDKVVLTALAMIQQRLVLYATVIA